MTFHIAVAFPFAFPDFLARSFGEVIHKLPGGETRSIVRFKKGTLTNGDAAKIVVAVVGLLAGMVALITALISRRKEVVNRHEFVHRQISEVSPAAPLSRGGFACPECGSADLNRVKAMHGVWDRLVLTFLLLWPWV